MVPTQRPRMPFSLPVGLASLGVALATLVLGLASVLAVAEPAAASALTLLATVAAPGLVFVALAASLAKSQGGAVGYSMLASAATAEASHAIHVNFFARPDDPPTFYPTI